MQPTAKLTLFRFAAVLPFLFTFATFGQSPAEEMLKLIPPDAPAAIVIPNLKAASDHITQMLEGMDRANLLMGSRPIDQAKSTTGFNVGINDAGGMALVFGAAKPENNEPAPFAVLVPVSDAQSFLDGNFSSHEKDAYKRADGSILYAKALGSHLVLSPNPGMARAYDAGAGLVETAKFALGQRGIDLMRLGEVFIIGRPESFKNAVKAMEDKSPMPLPLPFGNLSTLPMMQQMQMGVAVIDFDPLGFIARTFATFKADSPAAQLNKLPPQVGGASSSLLSRLPGKPFYFAASADVAGFGGTSGLNTFMQLIGLPATALPAWVTQANGLQFAAYPSPAGLAGGLLNDAVLVLQTSQPDQLKATIKEQMLAMQNPANGTTHQVKWEENHKVSETAGAADAYEIKVVDVSPDQAQFQMVSQYIFGRAGWRGFVKSTKDAVIVTFSQRPAVLDAALQAASNAAGATQLGATASIKTMRNMMPATSGAEVYINVAQLFQMVKQVAASFGAQGRMPELDANLPPIGFGAALQDRGLETSLVIPAGILAVTIDQAMQQMANRDHGENDGQPATTQPRPTPKAIPQTHPK